MTSYRDAAAALWGPAGEYTHDAYTRIRTDLFPQLPAEIPIVIGITAYGRCLGLTRPNWTHGPRISLASNQFSAGCRVVDDVMVHEMLHVALALAGRDTAHAGRDWYAEVRRLSPAVLGHDLDVTRGSDRRSVRVANPRAAEEGQPATLVRKVKVTDVVPHGDVARWPGAFRPEGYDPGAPIECPTY